MQTIEFKITIAPDTDCNPQVREELRERLYECIETHLLYSDEYPFAIDNFALTDE